MPIEMAEGKQITRSRSKNSNEKPGCSDAKESRKV